MFHLYSPQYFAKINIAFVKKSIHVVQRAISHVKIKQNTTKCLVLSSPFSVFFIGGSHKKCRRENHRM